MRCPLCHAELPDNARRCTECNWVRHPHTRKDPDDRVAAVLSIWPGLGHLYKGYFVPGFLLMFIISPLVLTLVIYIFAVTNGLSMVLFFGFIIGTAIRAAKLHNKRPFLQSRPST